MNTQQTETFVRIPKEEYEQLKDKSQRLDQFLDIEYWEHPSRIHHIVSKVLIFVTTSQEWGNLNDNSQGTYGRRIEKFFTNLTNLLFPEEQLYP